MIVTDSSGAAPVTYHVPMTYRGAPLDGFDAALIGVAEHGVLGHRWFYDGARDPIVAEQVLALVRGDAAAQMARESFTPDPSVGVRGTAGPDATVEVVRLVGRHGEGDAAHVEADWTLADGATERGPVLLVR